MRRLFTIVLGIALATSGWGQSRITGGAAISGGAKVTPITAPVTLVSIALSPTNPSISQSGSQQFSATGTYSDASTADVTSQCSWTSDNPAVASISSSGLASGVGVGSTTVRCQVGTVSGSTIITVTGATLACVNSDPAGSGWIKLGVPGTVINASGDYYIDGPVSCPNSCWPVNANNVRIHLQGNTVTYGTAQQVFQTFDKAIVRSTAACGCDDISAKGTWAALSNIIRVGNTPGASDYVYNTDFFISVDPVNNITGHSWSDPQSLYWKAGRGPAAGATYYVSYEQKEPAILTGNYSLSGNTTNFTTWPIVNTGSDGGIYCGTVQASPDASPFSTMLATNKSRWTVEDVTWESANPNLWNQLGFLSEGQQGLNIRRSKFTSASRWTTSRDNNHSVIIRAGSSAGGAGTTNPNIFEDMFIYNGPHIGIYTNALDSKVRRNYIRLKYKYTNGFAVSGYQNTEVYQNTIDCWDPADPDVGCRGIFSRNSPYVHDNVVRVHANNNNAEYAGSGGCEIGYGAYGLQTDQAGGSGGEIKENNDVTAVAWQCDGLAGRYTEAGSVTTPMTGYFRNEVYRAFRYNTTTTREAVALSFSTVYSDGALGYFGADSRLESDLYNVQVKEGTLNSGIGGIKLLRMLMVKGTLDPDYTCGTELYGVCSHPSASYHTWRMGASANIHCIDCNVLNGASLTDVHSTTSTRWDLWVDYTRSWTVMCAPGSTGCTPGLPLDGVTVTATDTAGGQYIAPPTDSNGQTTQALPATHLFNNGSTAVNTAVLNPYSFALTKANCTTINIAGVTLSGASSQTINMACSSPIVTLQSVTVSPATETACPGEQVIFEASCRYSDGSALPCNPTWNSLTGFVGVGGTYTNNACIAGSRFPTATVSGVSGSATISCYKCSGP